MMKSLLSATLFFSSYLGVAQDKVYLFNDEVIQGKVTEVGVDSVMMSTSLLTKHKPVYIANNKVNYILFENGDKYFVPHDMISIANGMIVVAEIKDTSYVEVRFYDLKGKSAGLQVVPVRKILSITFRNGDEIYYYDRINLVNGNIIAAEILEVRDDKILYRNPSKKKGTRTLKVSQINDIRFKNGYRQQFVQLEK